MTTKNGAKPIIFALVWLLLGVVFVPSDDARAFDLRGTAWEHVAESQRVDPYLMYAVALQESWRNAGPQVVAPWPWVVRTEQGPIYAKSKLEAIQVLHLGILRGKCVDVGIMQVSTCWHARRVAELHDLLDPLTNIRVGAEILREALDSAPNDLELAVGRYHNWSSETRARSYGRRVLELRESLLRLTAGRGGWLNEQCCRRGSFDRGAQ